MGGNGATWAMLVKLHAAGTCRLSAQTPAPGTGPGDALGAPCKQVAQRSSFSAAYFLWHDVSGFVHAVACVSVSFLPVTEYRSLAWLWHVFIHPAKDSWGVPTFRFLRKLPL